MELKTGKNRPREHSDAKLGELGQWVKVCSRAYPHGYTCIYDVQCMCDCSVGANEWIITQRLREEEWPLEYVYLYTCKLHNRMT